MNSVLPAQWTKRSSGRESREEEKQTRSTVCGVAGVTLCGDVPASLLRDRQHRTRRSSGDLFKGASVGLCADVPPVCTGENASEANPLQALTGCGRGWVFPAPSCSFLAVFGQNVAMGSTDRDSWRGM